MTELAFLYLTTTGHRSGNPHEIEIWYVEHEGCYYLVSEKRESSHWVRNIRADPAVRFRLGATFADGESTTPGTATAPDDPELIAAVNSKMQAKHGWSNGLVEQICGNR